MKIYDKQKEIYSANTRALVVDLLRKDEDGRYRSRFYPVLEFYAGGILHKVVYPEGSYPSRMKVGQEIAIVFDPEDPENRYVISENTLRSLLPQILQIAGAALILLGIALFIRFATRS